MGYRGCALTVTLQQRMTIETHPVVLSEMLNGLKLFLYTFVSHSVPASHPASQSRSFTALHTTGRISSVQYCELPHEAYVLGATHETWKKTPLPESLGHPAPKTASTLPH